MPTRSQPPAIAIVIFSAMAVVVAVIVIIAHRRERGRRREALEALQQAGFQLLHAHGAKNKDAAGEAFARLGQLRELRTKAKGVKLYARANVDGREVAVVEHGYVVSTGKSHHTVYHSIASVPCPAAWPELRLTPEHMFHKLADMVGHKDIRLEDDEFNARWRVKGRNEDFAVVLLSPPLQKWLTTWPKEYWLAIGGGAICVVTRHALTAERLSMLVRLATELAGMIPPEMEMWGAEDAGHAPA